MADPAILQVYADAGYVLTPLKGKVPTRKDWTKTKYIAKPDPGAFPENFGVVLQDSDLVVDCDPRNYKNNIDSLQKLKAQLNWKMQGTNTTVVRTGGGGYHIYLKKPASLSINVHHADFPGLEFKTKGAQVVGARCIHPDSKMFYNIVQGSFTTPIPMAPQAVLELITRKAEVVVESTAVAVVASDEQSKARFVDYCKHTGPATAGEAGDKTTFNVACYGRDLGLSEKDTYAIMYADYNPKCVPPWGASELKTKVKNAYAYAHNTQGVLHPANDFTAVPTVSNLRWDMTAEGQRRKTLNNCVNYFLDPSETPLGRMIAWDEFTHQVMLIDSPPWHPNQEIPKDGLPWTDEDSTLCRYYLGKEKRFDIPPAIIIEAVMVVSKKNLNHPVRNYLKSLKWDGNPRIDSWLTECCGVKASQYSKEVGAKTLLGAVARVFNPGVKFDYMLVLEGAQGTGKSSVVATLGGAWYGDLVINPHDKDTIAAMRGKWIVEASEMDFTTKAEAQAQKAFLSRQVDTVRFAYARSHKDIPRQCIIIGTMNLEADPGYLKDTTGNRRFWPVETDNINIPKLRKMRDQLFAEALVRWNAGESIYLEDREIAALASIEQHARRIVDPWTEKISDWLEHDNFSQKRDFITTMEVWVECLNGMEKHLDRRGQGRIVNVLKNELKWIPGQSRASETKRVISGYKRPDAPLVLELPKELQRVS